VPRCVECIEAPGVAHVRAERQRLAAGAGAEVDDHLAALRAGDQRQQLAALVLDLDVAAQEDVELVERGLAVDPQAERRMRRVDRLDAEPDNSPRTPSRFAFSALTRRSSGAAFSIASTSGQNSSPSAGRKRSASHSGRLWRSRSGRVDGWTARAFASHCCSVSLGGAQEAVVALPGQDRETALEFALARLREVLPQQALAQHRVGGLGERVALAAAERAMGAEVVGDDAVGGCFSCSTRCSSSVACSSRAFGCIDGLSLADARPLPPDASAQALRRAIGLKRTLRHLRAHPALSLAALAGTGAALLIPGVPTAVTRCLIGWNVGVWLYLAAVTFIVARADRGHLKRVAVAQAEGATTVLAVVALATLFTLGAVVVELSAAKGQDARHAWPHIALALATVVGSWLMLPVCSASTTPARTTPTATAAASAFPARSRAFEPEYSDFFYSRSRSRSPRRPRTSP
jgi:uncharacterized membrane protein